MLGFSLCSTGVFLGLLSFAATPAVNPNVSSTTHKIAPWVSERTANGQQAEFLVILADQADVKKAVTLTTKAAKGRYVRDELWNKAQTTQGPVLQWLRAHNVEHRAYYIVNAIWVKGGPEIAAALAARTDVLRIEGNPEIHNHIEPVSSEKTPALAESTASIEPGITNTRAPEVWALGYTGQGIVIAGADTGYQWNHPALKNQYRGWNGSTANHDYNWHDSIHVANAVCSANSPQPCDDQSHGTHTMGTAVGDDGGNNKIGMAPGAKWIGCRNMNQGVGTPARYIECMEFFLAPYPVNGTPAEGNPDLAPDITTNSWGCPPSEGCSADSLQAAVEAQRAAGIMMVVAAGNDGSSCSTVQDPPAIYDAVYSIGALQTGSGDIAGFSSRGPVTIDGSSRLKPDLSAPGTNTRSSIPNNSYASFSGTSMATPHVAGAVALLWSAQPNLRRDVSLTETILNDTAVHIPAPLNGCSTVGTSPNNTYGFGELDIKAAVDRVTTGGGTLPNLMPYQPPGWSDKVVVSEVTGTNTDRTNIIPSDTLFLDWALVNSGGTSINSTFSVELYVDDVFRTSWSPSLPIDAVGKVVVEDYNLGSLGLGTHTLRIKADATNAVTKSNESDNEYSKTIKVYDQRTYTVTTSVSPSNAGVINDPIDPDFLTNGTFSAGTVRRLTATSVNGFQFVNWSENGSALSTSHTFTFVVDHDRNIVANFTPAPIPVPTPTITISSSAAVVSEGQSATITFFASTVNPSFPLTVNYSVGGKAVFGVDYTVSGAFGQVTIPAGASSANVTLNALTDSLREKKKKLTLTLRPGSGYKLPKKKKLTLTIADVPPPATSPP